MEIFNLFHKLLLTTRQKTKLGNTFENNKSTDIDLSKAQMSKTNSILRIFRSIIR